MTKRNLTLVGLTEDKTKLVLVSDSGKEFTVAADASYAPVPLLADPVLDDGMPLQVKDTAKDNSTTTMVLTRVKKNQSVEGSVFKINPPKGTKVLKG